MCHKLQLKTVMCSAFIFKNSLNSTPYDPYLERVLVFYTLSSPYGGAPSSQTEIHPYFSILPIDDISKTAYSLVYTRPGFCYAFCQLHHVAFDWLKSHTPFPAVHLITTGHHRTPQDTIGHPRTHFFSLNYTNESGYFNNEKVSHKQYLPHILYPSSSYISFKTEYRA